jgi:DNA replication protein DnaC
MHIIDTDPALVSFSLERLQAQWAEMDAKLDALPQEQDCPVHGAGCAKLDRQNMRGTEPLYTCPACEADKKAAAASKRRTERLMSAGVPSDALHATLDNFDTNRPNVNPGFHTPAKFLAAAKALNEGRARNLILCGSPGIGKGHLAAAMAIAAYDAGKSIAWIDCFGLFRAVHAAYGDEKSDPRDITSGLGSVHLLVLDEIGLRQLPADGEEILFTILDARHKAAKQTILLGNKTAAEVKTWIGSRINDRLRSGGVVFCYGEWDSMRGSDADGAGWLDADELPVAPAKPKAKPEFKSCL